VKTNISKKLNKRKKKIAKRTRKRNWENQAKPMLTCPNIYYESDHVLNLAYNILSGGHCLQDIEFLRKNDGRLDALGAEIIPAPTTAGDFLRRFTEDDVIQLMEVKNTIRQKPRSGPAHL
jgi:hypothetical protein